MDQEDLAEYLIESGILQSPRMIRAFRRIDRGDFIMPKYGPWAYSDQPLPIAGGQSISQPFTVAFMLELLNPQQNQVILDVGTGSGWTTAMLAEIVGPKGRVYTTEIVPDLLFFARENLAKYEYKNIVTRPAKGNLGVPEFAPFEKILVSAEAKEIPMPLVGQLITHGTMVIPVNGSIVRIDKISDTALEVLTFPGFAFVPLQ
jgi:protein-L-isoaspartate(D-aspartate) O-methyltransferase